jgi:type I restriction enzyme, S subunit
VKSDWDFRPLGALCEVLDHLRKPVTKKDRLPGPYPYYGATGIVDYVSDFLFDEPLVLIGEDGAKWGSGDETAFAIAGPSWVNNHAHVVRPDRANVLDEWLVHYLVHQDLSRYVSGLTVPKLNQGSLREIPIPLPALSEQRRIVAVLDEAFEGISTAKAHAEKNLRNAREVFDSELQRVFSDIDARWPRETFESLAINTLIGLTRSAREQGTDLRCRYVKMNNITPDNRFDPHPAVSVDATDAEVDRFGLESGDFLFNTRNSHELVGKSCVYVGDEDEVLFNNNIMRVRFRSEVNSRFILYAFSYAGTRHQLEAMKSGTTNVAAIYARDLAKLSLPMPDVLTQQRVLASLVELSHQCSQLSEFQERKVAALDELKKSLLHQAFSGQL